MVVWGGVAARMLVAFIDDGDNCARRFDRSEVAIREIEIADVAEIESRANTDIAPAIRRAIRNDATLMVVCLMFPYETEANPPKDYGC
jgi:hypothetical protein